MRPTEHSARRDIFISTLHATHHLARTRTRKHTCRHRNSGKTVDAGRLLGHQPCFAGRDFLVKLVPTLCKELALDDAPRHVELVLLEARIVAQVDGLRRSLALVAAPALAPQPLLRQREDLHLVLRIVRQVLIEIRQRVRVARQVVVDRAQGVPDREAPEALQVHHIQGADVVWKASKVVLPVARAPELVAQRLLPGRAEGRVAVRSSLEVHIPQLLEIAPDDLIGVDVDDLLHVQGEEHVQEEDLVPPDDPLLLGRRQEVLEEPELHLDGARLHHRQHHDFQQALVELASGEAEDVHDVLLLAALRLSILLEAQVAETQAGAEAEEAHFSFLHVVLVVLGQQRDSLKARSLSNLQEVDLVLKGGDCEGRAMIFVLVVVRIDHREQPRRSSGSEPKVPRARICLQLPVSEVVHHQRIRHCRVLVLWSREVQLETVRWRSVRRAVALPRQEKPLQPVLDGCQVPVDPAGCRGALGAAEIVHVDAGVHHGGLHREDQLARQAGDLRARAGARLTGERRHESIERLARQFRHLHAGHDHHLDPRAEAVPKHQERREHARRRIAQRVENCGDGESRVAGTFFVDGLFGADESVLQIHLLLHAFDDVVAHLRSVVGQEGRHPGNQDIDMRVGIQGLELPDDVLPQALNLGFGDDLQVAIPQPEAVLAQRNLATVGHQSNATEALDAQHLKHVHLQAQSFLGLLLHSLKQARIRVCNDGANIDDAIRRVLCTFLREDAAKSLKLGLERHLRRGDLIQEALQGAVRLLRRR
eukprot:scaffold8485_cov277-Pinguiococcus_pyrenoidosus.AAC.8